MKTSLRVPLASVLLLGPLVALAQTGPQVSVSPTSVVLCDNRQATLTATASVANFSAGSALQFDGTDDFARVAHDAALDISSAITIEAWLNASASTAYNVQNVVCKSSFSQNTGYIFPRTDNNWSDLVFYLHLNGAWRIFSVPYSQYRGAWHHLAATYDGQRVKLFIDGVKRLDQAQTGTIATNSNPLSVGTQPGYGEFLKGQADEIRVWNIARSEADLTKYYGQVVSPAAAGLVAYYHADEGSGETLGNSTSAALYAQLGLGSTKPTWVQSEAPVAPALRYSWSPSAGLNLTDGPVVKALPEQTTTYTVRVTDAVTGLHADAQADVNISGDGSNVWTGIVSSDWRDPANWRCGTVPEFGYDVVIPAGTPFSPEYKGSTNGVRNITIGVGATFTFSGTPNTVFTVGGKFVNHGTFNHQQGIVSIAGATLDDIESDSPLSFLNLSINGAGARLAATTEVRGLLTLGGVLNTNGHQLTLKSNADGTASVYNNGTGGVVGPVRVQRYIDGSVNPSVGYRHLSSPVSGAPFSSLQVAGGTAPVLNPAYNVAANPGAVKPYPTVFAYDETRLTGGAASSFSAGWASPAAATDQMTAGQGYTVHTTPGVLTFVGPLHNGNYDVPLTRGITGQGWNLVGNPYPSPLNWDLVTLPAGIDAAAYLYQSTGKYTGRYVAYVNGVGASRAHLISMGQSFFVRANAGTPTLPLRNIHRETTLQPNVLQRRAETRPLLALALAPADAPADAEPADVFYTYRQEGATAAFDGKYDAFKLQPSGPSLYQMRSATELLAVQGLPADSQPQQLTMAIQVPAAGRYTLRPLQLENFAATEGLWLEDKQAGYWHNLRQGALTVELPQGTTAQRFVLHLGVQAPLATRPTAAVGSLMLYPNPTTGEAVTLEAYGLPSGALSFQLLNSLGQVVHTQTLTAPQGSVRQTLALPQLPAGVYTAQLHTAGGVLAHKLVIR
ncbi:T9SS type A sorting domain-containing protein [Hymenobacter sp. BT18]|uniref:LamG-like jellyroll fold domain-containing protein n=1 Tax=Hymenobacter sp. BT18 TaxID=2835648 RepID=UPI00143E998E|nr:LamG-like jellyroll fold domain-containing protein [Hymenobacter sp. BT18]QIX60833.1 T9SS type A sorting domain-containing protein [Hymenobacter sp. BT18]